MENQNTLKNKRRIIINAIIIALILAACIMTSVGKTCFIWEKGAVAMRYNNNPNDVRVFDWTAGQFEFSAFEAMTDSIELLLLSLFFPLANIALCLTSMISRRKGKDPVFHVIASILLFFSHVFIPHNCYKQLLDKHVRSSFSSLIDQYNMFSISTDTDSILSDIRNYGNGHYTVNSFITLYDIAAVILIVCIILSIVKRSSLITKTEAPYQPIEKLKNEIVETQTISNTEQLVELKKLFDNGVITKEEFDAKKKQLLGL